MARIVALYRYPIKGFTPEPRDSLVARPDGRIAGDRVLNLRFADAPVADDQWCRKYHGVVLVNTPGLARLAASYDETAKRLRISLGANVLVDAVLDPAGRQRIVDVMTEYVAGLTDSPLAGHPERLPLKLVGDGVTPRFQDNSAGQVTLHSRASIAAAAQALGDPQLDERRFRSNIAIDGVAAWEELSWVGRRVRIGQVEFDVVKTETRCLATHANPTTGERDLAVMQTLVKAFGQKEPTLAVGMMTRGAGGEIRVGDEVTVVS